MRKSKRTIKFDCAEVKLMLLLIGLISVSP